MPTHTTPLKYRYTAVVNVYDLYFLLFPMAEMFIQNKTSGSKPVSAPETGVNPVLIDGKVSAKSKRQSVKLCDGMSEISPN